MTTPELQQSIATRARSLRDKLNASVLDPVSAAQEAKRLFEDAVDESRTSWITLELVGYRNFMDVQPLHQILRVPPDSRLALHVAAYRTQRGFQMNAGAKREFSHFFVEPLHELVSTRDRIRSSGGSTELEFTFGPHAQEPSYPSSGVFPRDAFERILGGFLAALYLQLGEIGK